MTPHHPQLSPGDLVFLAGILTCLILLYGFLKLDPRNLSCVQSCIPEVHASGSLIPVQSFRPPKSTIAPRY